MWTDVRQAIVRYRVAIVVEVAMVMVWFVLRTAVDVRSGLYLVWFVSAAAIALVSPTSGLVVLMATVPYFEPAPLFHELGFRHVLIAVIGISVALRLAMGGWRQLPRSPALILGGVVLAITVVSLIHTLGDFDPVFGLHASFEWLKTTGGAMMLLIAGAWVARTGEARPLIAAAITCAVASVLSMIELVHPGLISHGPLSWIGFWKDFGVRVSGIIPAPNAVGTMLLIPATVAAAAAIQFRGVRRLGALIVALPMIAATILTLSRSAIAGLYVAAVVFISRRSRRTALVVLTIGLVVAVIALPLFIQFRANRMGVAVTGTPIDWIIGADEARVTAWAAGVRMWLASPIVGHGFLSYKALADTFGDPRLGSPHNEILRFFAEEGLVGGLVAIAFVGSLLRELWRRPGWIGAGLFAGAIGYWAGAMFNNPLLHIQASAMAFVFAGYGLTAPFRGELPQEIPTPSDATA